MQPPGESRNRRGCRERLSNLTAAAGPIGTSNGAGSVGLKRCSFGASIPRPPLFTKGLYNRLGGSCNRLLARFSCSALLADALCWGRRDAPQMWTTQGSPDVLGYVLAVGGAVVGALIPVP